jgi:uncharacterized protein (TIGR02300 family)
VKPRKIAATELGWRDSPIAQGLTVAKPELGTKRLCGNCGAKFYDLSKDPIVCPKCSTVFQVAAPAPRARQEAARPAPVAAEETAAPEPMEAEFVSLEEADAESQGGAKAPAAEGAEGEEEDIELDESLDDAAFIEETEEGEDDVTDIIGDVEDEEET